MFQSVLHRDDVIKLLKEVCNNKMFYEKNILDSLDYEIFVDIEQPLFIVVDALIKYQIIIDDEFLLDDYLEQLRKIMRKITNFHDIRCGINRIMGKFVARKMNLKDYESDDNQREILKYIYDKYIVNGYMFHSISNVYKDNILTNGLIPNQYVNITEKFVKVNNILEKYRIENLMETDFNKDYISITDSFIMAYCYAVNSPMYFYKLLCANQYMVKKKFDRTAYFKNDYNKCFKNLDQLLKKYDFNSSEMKYIKETCNEEWKLLDKNRNIPTVVVIKRSAVGRDSLKDIDDIISNCGKIDIGESVSKIIDSRYDNDKLDSAISVDDLKICELFKYRDLVEVMEEEEVTDTTFIKKMSKNYLNVYDSNQQFASEYGKVSILVLLGALLITLGVTITIIMISRGM